MEFVIGCSDVAAVTTKELEKLVKSELLGSCRRIESILLVCDLQYFQKFELQIINLSINYTSDVIPSTLHKCFQHDASEGKNRNLSNFQFCNAPLARSPL